MGEQGRNQIEGYGILGQDEAVLRIRAAPRQEDKKRRPDMVNVCRVNSEKSRRESALWRGSAYSRMEIDKRILDGNVFVKRVLAQPKLWVIGEGRDLAPATSHPPVLTRGESVHTLQRQI